MLLSKATYKWGAIQYKHITVKESISDKSATKLGLHQLKHLQDRESNLNMSRSSTTNTSPKAVNQTMNDAIWLL